MHVFIHVQASSVKAQAGGIRHSTVHTVFFFFKVRINVGISTVFASDGLFLINFL